MKIDIIDLLTEEHKGMLTHKITEAITTMDVSFIQEEFKNQIKNTINDYDFGEMILEDVSMQPMAEIIQKKMIQALKAK